ncbi:MAG: ATP-binding cassette domain-containing protein, partial [Bacilli bacterium]|nr:ATP-binding cassette domain-containing protein [Bacilli bacterium]
MYKNPRDKKHDIILKVEHLKMYFKINTGWFRSKPLKAVDDVSFELHRGETLGLVGESGCGKTTLGRTILKLYKPTAGTIVFNGEEINNRTTLKHYRQKSAIVFQDPYSSLDPRLTVEDIIAEPLDIHKVTKNVDERHKRVLALMKLVGLSSEQATRYAHEFSGGQRQRIGIARSLALNPEFIVCDEPVSALDVSIQAQVINTFEELQEK